MFTLKGRRDDSLAAHFPFNGSIQDVFMPVVGSTIYVDLHVTADADVETLRGITRQSKTQVHPDLAERVRATVERDASAVLDPDVSGVSVSVGVDLVTDRVPGAPRERVTVRLDFEGDDSALAAVDEAVGAPARAQLADELESAVEAYLDDHDLADGIHATVSVTPVQFR